MGHDEPQQDAATNLAAMQHAARQRLDDGTFSQYPAHPATDDTQQGETP